MLSLWTTMQAEPALIKASSTLSPENGVAGPFLSYATTRQSSDCKNSVVEAKASTDALASQDR
jgi:hypothetical protein